MINSPPPLPIDVVWLKKDVRLHDHGPLSLIAREGSSGAIKGRARQCIIIYLYEPDQLGEKTVHGSHVAFVNEGLVDLDLRLSGKIPSASENDGSISDTANVPDATTADDDKKCNNPKSKETIYQHKFQCITVCRAGAAFTFRTIHKQRPINQILCHMESGHLKSFARDKQVRRWCRANNINIREFDQSGVTRCLKNRDDFSKNFNKYLNQNIWETPTADQLAHIRQYQLLDLEMERVQLYGRCDFPLNPADIQEIPIEHRNDRLQRQYGGESKALEIFNSFLSHRGANYSSGISSPNTSWTTGSRLSPYLTWGHISLRYVIATARRRQNEIREAQKRISSSSPTKNSPWLRSLASFQSRMHWRSHFIQKLESQPSMEQLDQCQAFSHLRRQPGDFNEEYYRAWCEGRTGFPFVDACMRCLIQCGWLNFRMRAMLVSFATYNLWLDWKKIAGHLARVFLDYEPGIHYPQLQMQAGTTGINAMRVYNVTKQGKDQDPDGVFIKKYVCELQKVPLEHIHEPYNMPLNIQKKCGIIVGNEHSRKNNVGMGKIFQTNQSTANNNQNQNPKEFFVHYPTPIVDEKATAKLAKDKLSAVRKQESTKLEASQVYFKHGSRRSPGAHDRDGVKPKALFSSVKRVKVENGQMSLAKSWKSSSNDQSVAKRDHQQHCTNEGLQHEKGAKPPEASIKDNIMSRAQRTPIAHPSIASFMASKETNQPDEKEWNCNACTYLNEKPFALTCSMCGSLRQ